MNGYVAFYGGRRVELVADTADEAQAKAQKVFGAEKAWHVQVMRTV